MSIQHFVTLLCLIIDMTNQCDMKGITIAYNDWMYLEINILDI